MRRRTSTCFIDDDDPLALLVVRASEGSFLSSTTAAEELLCAPPRRVTPAAPIACGRAHVLLQECVCHTATHEVTIQSTASANIRLGWSCEKIFARAETGAERPLAALWVDSIRILSCFAGESGGRGDYAELQMVSKLFSDE